MKLMWQTDVDGVVACVYTDGKVNIYSPDAVLIGVGWWHGYWGADEALCAKLKESEAEYRSATGI